MKVKFLGQGLEKESKNAVGYYLREYLKSADFHSFTAISAFVSQRAVADLADIIERAKDNFKKLTIIVGVDQEGTSKEALEELLRLNINSYVFYQTEAVIFHPKIYLFEGESGFKLIIGSSNLTTTGLFKNVESSVLIEAVTDDTDGENFLGGLKKYYANLLDFTDCNLFPITADFIKDFNLRGIIPDEETRRKIYLKTTTNVNSYKPTIDIPERQTARTPFYNGQSIDFTSSPLLKNKSKVIQKLFSSLQYKIQALSKQSKRIEVYSTQNYIAFKTSEIFAEVRPQMKNIRIVLREVEHSDFKDVVPVPRTHGWGKRIKIFIGNEEKLIHFMSLIERSYRSTK